MKENLRRTLLPIFDYSNLPVSFPSENKYHMLNTSYFNIYLQGVRNKQSSTPVLMLRLTSYIIFYLRSPGNYIKILVRSRKSTGNQIYTFIIEIIITSRLSSVFIGLDKTKLERIIESASGGANNKCSEGENILLLASIFFTLFNSCV